MNLIHKLIVTNPEGKEIVRREIVSISADSYTGTMTIVTKDAEGFTEFSQKASDISLSVANGGYPGIQNTKIPDSLLPSN